MKGVGMERIQAFVTQLCQSLLSILKIVLQSRRIRRVKPSEKAMARGIVVLGNGPSLNDTVDSAADFLAMHDLLAVNFAACTPLFKQLHPAYYLLADGHFFRALDQPNVKQLWNSIAHVEWQMTLFVPARAILPQLPVNPLLTVARYNATPVEGFPAFEDWCYEDGRQAGDTGIVESSYGFHIIKCTGHFYVDGSVTSIDQIPEDLRNQFSDTIKTEEEGTAYNDWLNNYVDEADIQINEMPTDVPYNVSLEGVTPTSETEEGASGDETTQDEATE